MSAPDFATHYFLPSRRPFLNLSDLGEPEVFTVMNEVNAMRRQGLHQRPFGRGYIAWRRLTELRLRELFVAAGGRPERDVPHYFCLGASTWFEGLAVGMRSVTVSLADLPVSQTSFTLIDSFSAMGFGPEFGYPSATEPCQQAVYPLSNLDELVAQHGVPVTSRPDDYANFAEDLVDSFIEVQLWSDSPIRHLIG